MIDADQDNSTCDPARIYTAIITAAQPLADKKNSSLRISADLQKIKFLIGTSPLACHSSALDFFGEFQPVLKIAIKFEVSEQLLADHEKISKFFWKSSAG